MKKEAFVIICITISCLVLMSFLNITGYAVVDDQIRLTALDDEVKTGRALNFQIDLGQGIDTRNETTFRFRVYDESGNEIHSYEEVLPKRATTSFVHMFVVPKDIAVGKYTAEAEISYSGAYGQQISVTDTETFSIGQRWYEVELFGGITITFVLWSIVVILLLVVLVKLYHHHRMKKRKYHVEVLYKDLPGKEVDSAYLGNVVETEIPAYFSMKKLKTHTIVAGATGGGKTIAAQDICEEALEKGVSVIVFDPTAQWTGFLRECKERKMLKKYPKFGMSKKHSPKAFKGNIYHVKNYLEMIDIKKYIKPGEMTIFTINHLDNKQTDVFVANTIRQVFKANLDESDDLKLLMVYDEVHRLLPKFGGSGMGFTQIERGCREFRKWGVGLILISQVLSDFIGEVKANITTEIQMRTRDEGDLQRIEKKYGERILQQLIKESTGVGMLENPDYNKGQPYLVNFRPIRHSTKRLSDDVLEKYESYNLVVDDLQYQLEQLEEFGEDVMDIKLELNLAKKKVASGQFNMVDIYLESIKPKIGQLWTKKKKKPKKMQIKLVDKSQLERDFQKASIEREKWEAEQRKKKEEKERKRRQKEIEEAKQDME